MATAVFPYTQPRFSLPPSPPPDEHKLSVAPYPVRSSSSDGHPRQYPQYAYQYEPSMYDGQPVRRGSTGSPIAGSTATQRPLSPLPKTPIYRPSSPLRQHHRIGQEPLQPSFTLSKLLLNVIARIRGSKGASTAHNSSSSTAKQVSWVPSAHSLTYAGLCILWYLSSALSNNTGKTILASFRYPVTLTLVQFGFVAFYCILFCMTRETLSSVAHTSSHHHPSHRGQDSIASIGPPAQSLYDHLSAWGIKRPSKHALHGTLIMSFFQITGHVFSSMAIARVPVSTVHTIKALSPLFTVASYALLFGARYSVSTYIALIPLTLGVMLACSFDLRANGAGLICALGSTIIFVSQNIFSKKLLPKESTEPAAVRGGSATTGLHGRLDKVNLLLYSSGMAFLLMIPIWIYTDLRTQLQPKPTPPNPVSGSYIFVLFLLNGSVHFAQSLLAFSILARSSPVAYSIASLVKRVAVICLAIVWFGQSIGATQALGMSMTFGGLWMYNRAKQDIDQGERKRAVAEKRHGILLPQTVADARILASDYSTPEPSPSTTPLPSNLSPYATPTRAGSPPLGRSLNRHPMTWTSQQLDPHLGSDADQLARNRGTQEQHAPEASNGMSGFH